MCLSLILDGVDSNWVESLSVTELSYIYNLKKDSMK